MPSPLSIVPKIDAVAVRQEGPRVLLIRAGQVILDMPADAAVALGPIIAAQGRKAQECIPRVAMQVAHDEALLLRKGIPLSLTSHPLIRAEAEKEAVSNRALRRAMPGGVKSEVHVAPPSLIQHPAPEKSHG